MSQTVAVPDGTDRRREPRSEAHGAVRIGWQNPHGRFQIYEGTLADESASGAALFLRDAPPKRTPLQIMNGLSTRWAQLRSVHWVTGQVRVGLEYETEKLAFLD